MCSLFNSNSYHYVCSSTVIYVTLQARSSGCHITSTVIWVSHYKHGHLCVTLQARSSVCHITSTVICVSHYKHGHLCVTLQAWSSGCHITSTVICVSHYKHSHLCVTLQARSSVCHITSTVIWVSHYKQLCHPGPVLTVMFHCTDDILLATHPSFCWQLSVGSSQSSHFPCSPLTSLRPSRSTAVSLMAVMTAAVSLVVTLPSRPVLARALLVVL